MLVSILINGLVSGGMYAVFAVGFSLVFGVAKILNLAHTAFYMVAAFLVFVATITLGANPLIAAIFALIVAGLIGVICYKLCLDRVKVHETAVLIITVAIAIFFQEIFLLIFGEHYREFTKICHSSLIAKQHR